MVKEILKLSARYIFGVGLVFAIAAMLEAPSMKEAHTCEFFREFGACMIMIGSFGWWGKE